MHVCNSSHFSYLSYETILPPKLPYNNSRGLRGQWAK
jgi:hypothetical protein